MFIVRVLAVEGDRLICQVAETNDSRPLVPSRTLAFRFLWEPWHALSNGATHLFPTGAVVTPAEAQELGRRAPLTHALAGQDPYDLDWNRQANADRFIFCVGVTERQISADGFDPSYHSIQAQATCTIVVTDPAWLQHLTPGMEWDTIGFDEDLWHGIMPEWLTPTVGSLLRGIEAEGAVDRLPILADALEEAGCDNDIILQHCRADGVHARGCWVVEHLVIEGVNRLG